MENSKLAKRQELTLILKPLVDCNLNCKYCYISEDPHNGMRMDHGTLRNVIVRFLTYAGPERGVHFIWHGGEPLLMGRDFFEKVVEIQSEFVANYRIRNGIQTNATILTKDFLSFFLSLQNTILQLVVVLMDRNGCTIRNGATITVWGRLMMSSQSLNRINKMVMAKSRTQLV